MNIIKLNKMSLFLFFIIIESFFAQNKNSIEIEIKIFTMGD